MHEDSSIVVWDAEDTVYRKRQRLTLEEKSFRYSDSDHPIMIQGSMTDNAGHVSEEVLEQGIIIDTEKPVIKVEYDRNNQTEYYNTERKARAGKTGTGKTGAGKTEAGKTGAGEA